MLLTQKGIKVYNGYRIGFQSFFLFRYEEKLTEVGVENIATLELDVGSIIKLKQNETLTEKFKKVEQI